MTAEAHAGEAGSGADPSGPEPSSQAPPQAPDFEEALRQLGSTGRATLGAGSNAAKAFRILFAADVSLARSAFGRTLALTGVAIAFGASAWLLLMAALITFLSRHTGMSWTLALLLTALLSILATVASCWMAMRYFEHTRMQATRRQLARLGIGELADFMSGQPDASGRDDAEHAGRAADGSPLKKGLGVDVTPQ